jgi:cobaltochelatase CobS
MNQTATSTRTLQELFGLTDEKVRNVAFPVNLSPGPMVPAIEQAYHFQQDHVRRMLLWVGGVAGRNLLITGPTGCGKSSLIEQLCARIGRELYRVPCHGKMEFSELTGQLTVMPDGSTKFVHGPLPRAMLTGSVLLLDEMNFIHPSAIGALNTVLDGGPLLITETGESIVPHTDFRIVATGNALDHGDDSSLYRGTQRMNLALIQRFLTVKVDYLPAIEEAAMLHRLVPGLPGKVLGILAEVATDVRKAFKSGDIESTVSTRTLVKWARVLQARVPVLVAQPEEELKFALQFVLTDGLKPEDASAIEGTLQRKASGLKLSMPVQAVRVGSGRSAKSVKSSNAGPSGTSMAKTTTDQLHFLVNPNRQGKGGITFWAGIESSVGKSHPTFNGPIDANLIVRVTAEKDPQTMLQTMAEKQSQRGYTFYSGGSVSQDAAESVVRDVVKALVDVFINNEYVVTCAFDESKAIAEGIATQMGKTGRLFQRK